MSLYRIRYGTPPSGVITEQIVDPHGVALHPNAFRQASRASVFTSATFYESDLLPIVGGYFLVSQRARSVIDHHVLPGDIRRIPVDVAFGNHRRETYWGFTSETAFRVVDREKSGCKILPGTDLILTLEKWIVSAQLVPPYDLFQADKMTWMSTQSLMDDIVESGFTNFEFVPLDVVE